MTALSAIQSNPASQGGATLQPLSSDNLLAALNLRNLSYWNPVNALSKAKAFGLLDAIPAAADEAAAALEPVGHDALTKRLTLLGMTMLHGKGDDEKAAWLHETARLLQDYPQAILFDAIDACLREPGRVFAPTVGEIIGKLQTPLREAEIEAAHLRELAIMLADGVEIPDYQPPAPASSCWMKAEKLEEYCKPEEAAAILEEFGLRGSTWGNALEASANAAKPMTRAECIAQGRVPPRRPDPEPVWDGMP